MLKIILVIFGVLIGDLKVYYGKVKKKDWLLYGFICTCIIVLSWYVQDPNFTSVSDFIEEIISKRG